MKSMRERGMNVVKALLRLVGFARSPTDWQMAFNQPKPQRQAIHQRRFPTLSRLLTGGFVLRVSTGTALMLLLVCGSASAYVPSQKSWSLWQQPGEFPTKIAACLELGPAAADKQMRGTYPDYPANWTILGNYRESANGLNCSYDAQRTSDGVIWVGGIGFRIAREWCPVLTSTFVSGWGCQCNLPGFVEDETHTSCKQVPASQPPNMCMKGASAGNPILPATAEKYRSETDWTDQGPDALSFTRTYRSNWVTDDARLSSSLSQVWAHSYSVGLNAIPVAAPLTVAVILPEGHARTFSRPSTSAGWSASDSADTLMQATDGSGSGAARTATPSTTLPPTANCKQQSHPTGGRIATRTTDLARSPASPMLLAVPLSSPTLLAASVPSAHRMAGRLAMHTTEQVDSLQSPIPMARVAAFSTRTPHTAKP
jgi:hypothetical protein